MQPQRLTELASFCVVYKKFCLLVFYKLLIIVWWVNFVILCVILHVWSVVSSIFWCFFFFFWYLIYAACFICLDEEGNTLWKVLCVFYGLCALCVLVSFAVNAIIYSTPCLDVHTNDASDVGALYSQMTSCSYESHYNCLCWWSCQYI